MNNISHIQQIAEESAAMVIDGNEAARQDPKSLYLTLLNKKLAIPKIDYG